MNGFTENDDVLYQVDLAQKLGLHPHEISKDSQKLARFQEIAEFMKPYQDSGAIIGRLVTRVPKDQVVDHVWRYVGLQKEYKAAEQKLSSLKDNLALYER
jgi:peroxiredoxin